jgi:hypothetical protein
MYLKNKDFVVFTRIWPLQMIPVMSELSGWLRIPGAIVVTIVTVGTKVAVGFPTQLLLHVGTCRSSCKVSIIVVQF